MLYSFSGLSTLRSFAQPRSLNSTTKLESSTQSTAKWLAARLTQSSLIASTLWSQESRAALAQWLFPWSLISTSRSQRTTESLSRMEMMQESPLEAPSSLDLMVLSAKWASMTSQSAAMLTRLSVWLRPSSTSMSTARCAPLDGSPVQPLWFPTTTVTD